MRAGVPGGGEDSALAKEVAGRYAGWKEPANQEMLGGKMTLEQIAAKTEANNSWPEPKSGRHERYENLVTRYL